MISSTLVDQPFRHFCHELSGDPTVQDIALAIQHTLQHDDIPVLWDLRKLPMSGALVAYEEQIRELIRRWRPDMSGAKRVFVVDGAARAAAEEFLGGLQLPWSWAVFDSYDEALDWLQG